MAAHGHPDPGLEQATLRSAVLVPAEPVQMLNEGSSSASSSLARRSCRDNGTGCWNGSRHLTVSDIVIMDNSISKEEMHISLAQTLRALRLPGAPAQP